MTPVHSRAFVGYNILLLAIGSVVLLTLVSAAFLYSDRSQDLAAEALRASRIDRLVLEIVSDLVDAETSQRGFIITEKESYLAPYETALVEFARDADELRRRAAEIGDGRVIEPRAVEDLLDIGARKMDLVKQNLAEFRAGHLDELRLVISSDSGKVLMDAVRTKSAEIRDLAAAHRIASAAAMRDASATLTTLISIGVAMIVVLTIGAALFIRRRLLELEETRRDLVEINADLEARVRERTETVLRANDELQRYAYIVGHDLRAPLVNIMGFTSELESSVATIRGHLETSDTDRSDPARRDLVLAVEEDIPEALGFIRTSINRMDNLINEILKLSRVGRRVLEPATVDTHALVSECIGAIRQRFDEAGAEVVVEGRLPTIVTDRAGLEQIFSNLLDNAAKYLVADRPGRIVVRGRIERDRAVFEVEDNGRGIAPADHERVFELFRRAGVQDRPGEGNGLAHTRAWARRLGGNVTVASDGTNGTTFRIAVAKDLVLRLGRGEP
jgi:signal transduction histidine kinase